MSIIFQGAGGRGFSWKVGSEYWKDFFVVDTDVSCLHVQTFRRSPCLKTTQDANRKSLALEILWLQLQEGRAKMFNAVMPQQLFLELGWKPLIPHLKVTIQLANLFRNKLVNETQRLNIFQGKAFPHKIVAQFQVLLHSLSVELYHVCFQVQSPIWSRWCCWATYLWWGCLLHCLQS